MRRASQRKNAVLSPRARASRSTSKISADTTTATAAGFARKHLVHPAALLLNHRRMHNRIQLLHAAIRRKRALPAAPGSAFRLHPPLPDQTRARSPRKQRWPGSISARPISSASITSAPKFAQKTACTVLLPLPNPPVRPTRKHTLTAPAASLPRAPCWPSASRSSADPRLPAPACRRRPARSLWMHVAHNRRTALREAGFALLIAGEEASNSSRVVMRLIPTSITVAPGFTISGSMKPGRADSRNQNVGLARDRRQVARLRVANRHRGILMQQQHRHRLAHNIAAPHNHGMLPADRKPARFRISITPAGVHGASAGRPACKRPAFTG
jgi:hypothetical protein